MPAAQEIGHEVLTLGGAAGLWNWEPTDDPPHRVLLAVRPICTRCAFYWTAVVGRLGDPRPTTELLRFCLHDEAFAMVPNPPCFPDPRGGGVIGDRDPTLTELGGGLCCTHVRTPTAVDVWLADDGPWPEWTVACRPVEQTVLPLAAHGDELILAVHRSVLYRYDAASKVVDMQWAPDLYRARPVVPYVESLL